MTIDTLLNTNKDKLSSHLLFPFSPFSSSDSISFLLLSPLKMGSGFFVALLMVFSLFPGFLIYAYIKKSRVLETYSPPPSHLATPPPHFHPHLATPPPLHTWKILGFPP